MQRFITVLVAAAFLSTSVAAQTAAELLQKGIYAEDTVGDIDAALAVFRQIVKTPSSQRRYAAHAQARIVRCLLEQRNATGAAQEFDILVRDYAEFKDIVSAAAAALRGRAAARQSVQLASGPTRITIAIRGRVTDDTGRPLRAAQVRLSAPGGAIEPRTVGTDEEGRYQVDDVHAGRYTIAVTHAGYLPLRYGQRRPRELGRLLDVADGQVIENVDFMLPRMGVIAGRVVDESKEPVADALVFAMRSVYFDGRRQRVPTGSGPIARTDDAGEFRVTGLAPGHYSVLVRSGDTWSVDESGTEQVGYAPTFYPATTAPAAAREIAVGIGQEVANVDVPLIPMRTATLSGTALDSQGRPLPTVVLAQEIRGEGFGSFGAAGRAAVGSDGRFRIAHVPAGHYKLEATTLTLNGSSVDPPEMAIVPIDVAGEDIDGLALVGSTGGFVSGRIVSDSAALPKLQDVRIRIAPRLMGQPEPLKFGTFGNQSGAGFAEINDDGTFVLEHAFGPARVQVTLRDGWALRAIRRDGSDITDAVLEFASGQRLTDVEIVLTQRTTGITGQVIDARGLPTADGTVVAFSTRPDTLFEDSRHVQAVRPDQHGRYEIRGLPAGEYLIAAIDEVDQNDWWDPDFLNRVRAVATHVTLTETASVAQTLSLDRR
jgi:protocatechuate 3,4-dioxygenase beta subunit